MPHHRLKPFVTAFLLLSLVASAASAAGPSSPAKPLYGVITYAGIGDYYTVCVTDTVWAGHDDYAVLCDHWGLIDAFGREVIPRIYCRPIYFNDAGFAIASTTDSTVAVIDIHGRRYTASMPGDMISMVMSDEPGVCYGIIRDMTQPTRVVRYPDNKAVTQLPVGFGVHETISQGRIPVFTMLPDGTERCGFYDLSGQEVVPPVYFMVGSYSEGLAAFMLPENGSFDLNDAHILMLGFLDLDGNVVIPADYKDEYMHESLPHFELTPTWFSEGLAGVSDGTDCAYIDTCGRRVIENPEFLRVGPFENGRAFVVLSDFSCRYIDRAGNLLDDKTDLFGVPQYGLEIVSTDNGREILGFHDASGRIVIPCRYPQASDFNENYAIVTNPDTGYADLIDANGNPVLKGIAEYGF